MFDVTFDEILKRMLDKVPNSMDKREGSIIYDALAPAAIELNNIYIALNLFMEETFGDTASRDFLIRRAAERGITPIPSKPAIVKGEFNIPVPLGARFNLDDVNYTVVEHISDNSYKLECEEYGSIGNGKFGQLVPIDYINGLEHAELTELLILGENEEDTESLRKRYFGSFRTHAYGGNRHDYLEKTNSIQGVGATKVTPVWNGGGTVKLTIVDSQFNPASSSLIQTVQEIIDPTKDGRGIGIAPIGHIVTVDTAESVDVHIQTSITFDTGYSFAQLKTQIIESIHGYLNDLKTDWANKPYLIIRLSRIESKLMGIDGIVDINNTMINDNAANLELDEYQIPNLGGVTHVE